MMNRFLAVFGLLLCFQAELVAQSPSLPYRDNGDGTVTLSSSELQRVLNEDSLKLEEAAEVQLASNQALTTAYAEVNDAANMLRAEAERKRGKLVADKAIQVNLDRTVAAMQQSQSEKIQLEGSLAYTQGRFNQMSNTVGHLSNRLEHERRVGWVPFPLSIFTR